MASTRVVLPWSTWATMATFLKLGRESTLVIVAVRVPDHENDENSEMRECEAQQVRRPQTEEEVLPQQAPLQTLPAGAAQGAQGRDDGHPRQGIGQGVQACAQGLISAMTLR